VADQLEEVGFRTRTEIGLIFETCGSIGNNFRSIILSVSSEPVRMDDKKSNVETIFEFLL
jgi:hypothetical protein